MTYALGDVIVIVFCAGMFFVAGRSLIAEVAHPQVQSAFDLRGTSVSWLYVGASLVALSSLGVTLHYSHVWRALPVAYFAPALFAGIWCLLLGSFRVRVADDALEYWSIENGYQKMRADQIGFASVRVGPGGPFYRLEVVPADSRLRTIKIALRPFRGKDLRPVLEWLGPKLKDPD